MMDNLEIILEELEKFEKESNATCKVPEILEKYLKSVATNGNAIFPWARIRHLLRHKLASVMGDFYDHFGYPSELTTCNNPNIPAFTYAPARDKILEHFDTFAGIPFTIQRLCEILVFPTKHYKRTDKFLRGLEKNILVVSYIEPGQLKEQLEESPCLVNGLEGGGSFHLGLCSPPNISSHLNKRSIELTDNETKDDTINGEVLASNGTGKDGDDDDGNDLPQSKRQKLEPVKLQTPAYSLLQERLQTGPSISGETTDSSNMNTKREQHSEISGNETEDDDLKSDHCEGDVDMEKPASTCESEAEVSTESNLVDNDALTSELGEADRPDKENNSEEIEAISSDCDIVTTQSPDNSMEFRVTAYVPSISCSEVQVGSADSEVESSFNCCSNDGQWETQNSPDNSQDDSKTKDEISPDSAAEDTQISADAKQDEKENDSEAAAAFSDKMELTECDSQKPVTETSPTDLEADSTAQHTVMQESSISCDSMDSASTNEAQFDAATSSEKEECTSSEQSTSNDQEDETTDQKSVDSSCEESNDTVDD